MSVIPEHFKLTFKPVAPSESIVQCGSARFTVLTARLIRLEYHPEGCFVDRASQAFWFREQPVPPFTSRVQDHIVEIETEDLSLHYSCSSAHGFSPDNLVIRVKSTGTTWHPGDTDTGNLHGTARTLDFANGYRPLESGLMSQAGWSVIDDSNTLLFDDDGWLQPRLPGGVDLYFFGYGHDYRACLQDYCRISGHMPMIPRWVLGNWWSRYWAYSQDDLTALINDFRTYDLPFSVCILDMDWHITQTGNDSTGWTGYTWNRDLFPDPEGFIKFVHRQNMRIGLNLHPAEGIHPHEDQYEDMARMMHIDPASQQPVPFEIANPVFANAYLTVLHHPSESLGVDFWWLDWQQGLESSMPGLDPLWLINHLHFYDLGRDGSKRPFIFSRWGGEGHQRYPIGFSGDSYATWDTLNFQPYMTATASNIAYGWWSHDIGGHTGGVQDCELLARWVQFGVLSPINRLHATQGLFYDRRPWIFEDAEVLRVLREALQLRHALIPYLYTMARRAYDHSLPLIEPMYYSHPDAEEAYHCPHQYWYGSELIAAPFVSPADDATGLSRQVVWLPDGDWYHVFTGAHYGGNRWQPVYGRLADIPLFARAGAIIPLADDPVADAIDNPGKMQILVFAGADNTFTLYEDDGLSTAYRHDRACRTTLTQAMSGDHLVMTVGQPTGDTTLIPPQRTYSITVYGVSPAATVHAAVNGDHVAVETTYDNTTEALRFTGIILDRVSSLQLTITTEAGSLRSHRDRTSETLLRMLKFFKLHTGVRNAIASELDAIITHPVKIAPYIINLTTSQARALCEILFDAGLHYITDTIAPTLLLLWNNAEDAAITFRYGDSHLFFGSIKSMSHDGGVVPRFAQFIPPTHRWSHGAQDEVVHRTQWHAQIDYANIFTASEGYREVTP